MKAKAGSIVMVMFPYEGKSADKPHPAFVLDVLDDGRAVVAYGSSKHVDISCPRPSEVVVSDASDLATCGLVVPTRFDLSIRAAMFVEDRQIIGDLPQNKYKQLYRAAVHCRLIKA